MFEFFDSVLGAIETALSFLYNLVRSLILAIDVISASIGVPMTLVAFLPGIIGSAIVVLVALGVIKFILGR